ncbi:hypothetical protein C8R45DRAFT_1217159 [Mycena sanguinolenta]|nr:hypothetical protein C8R45DRAFT_1217159 [Mycena sanguinolenta]
MRPKALSAGALNDLNGRPVLFFLGSFFSLLFFPSFSVFDAHCLHPARPLRKTLLAHPQHRPAPGGGTRCRLRCARWRIRRRPRKASDALMWIRIPRRHLTTTSSLSLARVPTAHTRQSLPVYLSLSTFASSWSFESQPTPLSRLAHGPLPRPRAPPRHPKLFLRPSLPHSALRSPFSNCVHPLPSAPSLSPSLSLLTPAALDLDGDLLSFSLLLSVRGLVALAFDSRGRDGFVSHPAASGTTDTSPLHAHRRVAAP